MSGLWRPYARVFASRSYLPLWVGQLVSNLGDTIHYVALVVLVYRVSGSGLAVSSAVAFEIVPILLLGPVAGVVIDRLPRKAVLIGSDLARAALVLALAFTHELWLIYALTFLLASAGIFFNPAAQATIPAVVDKEALVAANSVGWLTGRLVQLLASAVGGGLVAWLGTTPAFLLNGATFVLSALAISTMHIPPHAGELSAQSKRGLGSYFGDALEGLRYARRDPFISRLLPVQALAALSVGATSALLVVLAERHLGLPPAGFAWLLGAIAVGGIIGSATLGALLREPGDARLLFVPYVVRGVGDVLIAVFTPLPAALLLMFLYGTMTSTGAVAYAALMQTRVPEGVRGRVYTTVDVTWQLMRLTSLAVGGALVDTVGVRGVYYAGGALLVAAGLLGLRLLGGDVAGARGAIRDPVSGTN